MDILMVISQVKAIDNEVASIIVQNVIILTNYFFLIIFILIIGRKFN